MCFWATANFVGSAALGAVGIFTLTRVKHRREQLFASLPLLFAIHQFIEGFVWLGLDGTFSPAVTHDMGAAFISMPRDCSFPAAGQRLPVRTYCEGPCALVAIPRARHSDHALHIVGLDRVSNPNLRQAKQHRLHEPSHQ
jgi:hypothetical protein